MTGERARRFAPSVPNPYPPRMPTSKVCSVCKNKKPLSAFQKDSSAKSGLRSGCKNCVNARKKERYNALPPLSPKPVECSDLKKICTFTERILKKYGACFNLVVTKHGYARIQVHTSPALSWKGESVQGVMEMALAGT